MNKRRRMHARLQRLKEERMLARIEQRIDAGRGKRP